MRPSSNAPSSPFIWVKAADCNITDGFQGRKKCNDKFVVAKLTYKENGDIDGLVIMNQKTGKVVFMQMPTNPKNKESK